MTDLSLAQDGRARHWLYDALLGSAVALCAITVAHAALPDRFRLLEPKPAVERIVLTSAPAAPHPQAPPVLIAFGQPVPGREVVSPFGLRQLPWEEGGRLHAGVDILAEQGEPVLAAADGVVTEAGHSSTYGRYVLVQHVEGLTTLYAHLGAIEPRVGPGVALKGGEALGRIGSTGTSTGPHLHFEVRDAKDRPLNPEMFLGKAFAEADDLPLRKARRFGRKVRVAYVSMIPQSKRALMEAKLEKEAEEKALKLAKLAKPAKAEAAAQAPAARDALSAAQPAAAVAESIEGLKAVTVGDDGRPRAQIGS